MLRISTLIVEILSRHPSACGGTLTSLAGVIKSPNFPNNYINGVNCVYVITAPHNYRVTLTFTAFSLEAASDCRYDYVEVSGCFVVFLLLLFQLLVQLILLLLLLVLVVTVVVAMWWWW